MERTISRYFTDCLLVSCESDKEEHTAEVVQRLRPPTREDAELLGLKRIQEYSTGFPPKRTSSSDTTPVGFIEGQGSYIREYFELVIVPIIAKAQAVFRPHSRFVDRTASDVTYVVEMPQNACSTGVRVLKLHSELYDALVDEESCDSDICVDFVVVSGKMFYNNSPEFFHTLLVAYQFPFGVVLLHKSSYPHVLVIVSYSMKRGMTVLGGAGDPSCGVVSKHCHRKSKEKKKKPVEKSDGEDDVNELTIWYSKPWIHPANSMLRLLSTDDDDDFFSHRLPIKQTTVVALKSAPPLRTNSFSEFTRPQKHSVV